MKRPPTGSTNICGSRGQPWLAGAYSKLFVTEVGDGISKVMVWRIVKRYAAQARIRAPISPHTLRHSFATHLMDNGANLRAVQLLLGHVCISTTGVYTRASVAHLKKLHMKCHPRG